MSIFDTLKFRLSEPPTYEELKALPYSIIRDYKFACFHDDMSRSDMAWNLRLCYKDPQRVFMYLNNISKLKELIYEYEDDNI